MRESMTPHEMDSRLRGNDSIFINPMNDKCRVIPANAGIHFKSELALAN